MPAAKAIFYPSRNYSLLYPTPQSLFKFEK